MIMLYNDQSYKHEANIEMMTLLDHTGTIMSDYRFQWSQVHNIGIKNVSDFLLSLIFHQIYAPFFSSTVAISAYALWQALKVKWISYKFVLPLVHFCQS